MESRIILQAVVPYSSGFRRLDQVAAELFPEYSRSRLQSWIKTGQLLVDGQQQRASSRVIGGESLQINAQQEVISGKPEPLDLNIVFEDQHLLVIDKPAGLVVHPGAGNLSGTMMNGLLHYDESLAQIPRAGIVHRLDRGTSGLMVVARTLQSQTRLVEQLQSRSVRRVYEAVVNGNPEPSGKVDAPIGRHRYHRTKMTVRDDGKPAVTHYHVLSRFHGFCLLEVSLETGRTHQIRVHMQYLGHSLAGDVTYGGHPYPMSDDGSVGNRPVYFDRPALHAKKLALLHPVSGVEMDWEVSAPEDFTDLIDALAAYSTDL